MSHSDSIESLRGDIDAIDDALVALLDDRAAKMRRIWGLKLHAGLPLSAPEREEEILARASRLRLVTLDACGTCRVLDAMLRELRDVLREGLATEAASQQT